MEYTNEESDGKKVAKWTREEVDEIVIAQVLIQTYKIHENCSMFLFSFSPYSPLYFCLLGTTLRLQL